MPYSHLALEERHVIYHLVLYGFSCEIDRRLNRNHATISREVKRNRPTYADLGWIILLRSQKYIDPSALMFDDGAMKPIKQFPLQSKQTIQFVLTDIDDTLTVNGRLPAIVFSAMEKLHQKNIHVIPITGRPAGWCDHIARMWPVAGLVGENGAFYFHYEVEKKKMIRRYFKSEPERLRDQKRLGELKKEILKQVPGSQVSADQAYREADLAIDFCEDVTPLSKSSVDKIVQIFQQAGAQAKISSIHVNGWFGQYDKLTMTKLLFKEIFKTDIAHKNEHILYIGDSPNDCPMFEYFTHSVGVANVGEFEGMFTSEPAWVTEKAGGYGFAEMVATLLA